MRRRKFIGIAGGVAVSPLATRAQQPRGVRKVGVFLDTALDTLPGSPQLAGLREGLGRQGWREDQNLQLLVRNSAADPKQLQSVAQELVERTPEVIVAHGSGPLRILLKETSTIPIVFVQVTDPVGRGFVKNLAHPNGNATGFSNLDSAYGGKLVQILTEIAPEIRRVTLLGQPETSPIDLVMSALQPLASSLSVEVAAAPVHDVGAIEAALAPLTGQAGCGLVVMPDVFTTINKNAIVALVTRQRLPAIYPFRHFVQSGGLVSYGNNPLDQFQLAAVYVDKILKGIKPADLPVQQPTKFELVINIKTARALGLNVPQSLLARADEVIE